MEQSSSDTTGDWKKIYSEDFTTEEKEKIIGSLKKAIGARASRSKRSGESRSKTGEARSLFPHWVSRPLWKKKKNGTLISPSGRRSKRSSTILIPEFSVRTGGATSIDVTKPGIDKAYGIRKLRDILGISIEEMIFIGDALFPGGNDYPAEEAGVVSIPVRDPDETKRVIETIIACLADHFGSVTVREGDSMSEFSCSGSGLVMEPEPGNPQEVEGVLNPAAARGPDGELYLFPRLVARGNYSRIGIARVRFNEAGDPAGVERLGIALEPEADYERRPDGSGGCEDPRITFVEPLQRYVMTYTAFSAQGPRIALAALGGSVPLAALGARDLRSVSRHRIRRRG